PYGLHRALGARGGCRAGEDRPRLRDGVDAALVALRRAERRPVVEVAAAIPRNVPAQLEHVPPPVPLGAVAGRAGGVAALVAEPRETSQDVVQEEADE